jgi:acylglycerol lipase
MKLFVLTLSFLVFNSISSITPVQAQDCETPDENGKCIITQDNYDYSAPDNDNNMTGEQFIESKDGTQLFVKQFSTASPKAQVLVLHGYLEYSLRYTEFAEYLNGKGISVTVFDYRGHGKSGGDRAFLKEWKSYHEDLDAARSTLLPSDKLPTFLFGHSNGGLILMTALLEGDLKDAGLKGIVLTGPYVAPAVDLPFYKIGAAKIFGTYVPSLKVPADLTGSDLTSDPQKIKEHDEDPLVLASATAGWALQAMKAQAKVQEMVETTKVSIPILLAYGSDDRVANPKTLKMVGDKLQADDKTIVVREGELHEIVNEVKRTETFDLIGDWILKRA